MIINPETTGEIDKDRSIILNNNVRPENLCRAIDQAAHKPNIVLMGTKINASNSVTLTALRKSVSLKLAKNGSIPL
jgi:hypothetical protein